VAARTKGAREQVADAALILLPVVKRVVRAAHVALLSHSRGAGVRPPGTVVPAGIRHPKRTVNDDTTMPLTITATLRPSVEVLRHGVTLGLEQAGGG